MFARYEERLQHSLMSTISVPMKLASTANSLWPTFKELAAVANIACKSDLQVEYNGSFSVYVFNQLLSTVCF